MNKSLCKALIVGGIAVSSCASPAIAGESGFYGTASVGITSFDDTDWNSDVSGTYNGQFKYNSGLSWEAGFGYDFGGRFRTELTYVQAEGPLGVATFDQTDGQSITGTGGVTIGGFVASAYVDILKDSKFTPYLGGGIGSFSIDTDAGTIAGVDVAGSSLDTIGYRFKAGASYNLGKSDIFAEATYLGVEAATIDSVNYAAIGGYGFLSGIRYKF